MGANKGEMITDQEILDRVDQSIREMKETLEAIKGALEMISEQAQLNKEELIETVHDLGLPGSGFNDIED